MEDQVADNQWMDEMLSTILSDGKKGQGDPSSSGNTTLSFNTSDLDALAMEIVEKGNVSIDQDVYNEPSTSLETAQVNHPNVMLRTPANYAPPTQVPHTVANGAFLSVNPNNSYTMVAPSTTPAITASFVMGGQTQSFIIPVNPATGTVPVVAASTADVGPTGLASAAATSTEPAPSSSQVKKRKLYEESEFVDNPAMEKKRRNAINAKNHRDRTKFKIEELDSVKKERDEFKELNARLVAENEEMKMKLTRLSENPKLMAENEQLKQLFNACNQEIANLKEENARLKQQCEEAAQQDKIGVLDMDLLDLLKDDVSGLF